MVKFLFKSKFLGFVEAPVGVSNYLIIYNGSSDYGFIWTFFLGGGWVGQN